jgi:ZIP family zinc transporter
MDLMDNNVCLALGLTLFAGLSTGIGSLIAFFARRTGRKFLSVSLGFSAGVMIYVSMVEIFTKARMAFVEHSGSQKTGTMMTIIAFFSGMLLIALIDRLIPSYENPHEVHSVEDMKDGAQKTEQGKLMRMGFFMAVALAIHNFPEGLATFIAGLHSPSIALPVAAAIAIHNIPEGISVSVPIYYATGSRKKALFYSVLSGFAEPVGAIIGYLLLMPFLNQALFGFVFAAVAGIMVFISVDELLPAAREYGEHHLSIYGLVAGMFVMAMSLFLFI